MIIQITRLPCLKPFCGFPSRTEGDQIPDHGLQGPAPDHPAPGQPSSLWLRHRPSALCPLRVSAFAVLLAQDALPMNRILLRCHLCRSHLVRDTPLEFYQGSLVSFAGDPTAVWALLWTGCLWLPHCRIGWVPGTKPGISQVSEKVCPLNKQNTTACEVEEPKRDNEGLLNWFSCICRQFSPWRLSRA